MDWGREDWRDDFEILSKPRADSELEFRCQLGLKQENAAIHITSVFFTIFNYRHHSLCDGVSAFTLHFYSRVCSLSFCVSGGDHPGRHHLRSLPVWLQLHGADGKGGRGERVGIDRQTDTGTDFSQPHSPHLPAPIRATALALLDQIRPNYRVLGSQKPTWENVCEKMYFIESPQTNLLPLRAEATTSPKQSATSKESHSSLFREIL